MNQKKSSSNVRHDARRPARGKRGLSASERRRLLQERRMRRIKQQFVALLVGLATLVVLLVLILTNQRNVVPVNPSLTLPAAAQVLPLTPTTPEPTSVPLATVTVAPTATPAPTVRPTTPAAMDEPLLDTVAGFDPSAPFSYEEAYAAAVLGANTGASIVPDYSNVDPAKLDRWPGVEYGFMPMLARANTSEKIIAVTVDDCFQADNLRQIVSCALKNDAKLTIFPIGTNLEKPSVAEIVKAAWKYGMEIENHTYSHAGTYHYDDEGMTDDIWRQSYLLNQALGVNYRQHFFRPKGGDERFDQRTHAYVSQLGFSAIALWTQSGSVDSMSSLLNNLAPGNIYLFHTTNNDLKKLKQFIPAAVERGYRLVTLNEMFGLPDNETSDLSTAPTEKPALASFQVLPMTLKATSYARAAAVVQERLIELGWMHGEPTGVYGKTTQACMELFQLSAELDVDGAAGTASQSLLFSAGAPTATPQRIRELALKLNSENQSAIREMLEEYP